MNLVSKKILESFMDSSASQSLKDLVGKILTFNGFLDDLTLEYLRKEAPVIVQPVSESVDATVSQDPDTGELKDYRIKRLAFHNFRTFPDHQKTPYSISFVKEGSDYPCSLFLVGKNGTGKSTIFNALEWIYAGKVRNAEERGVRNNEQEAYLTYGFGKLQGVTSSEVCLDLNMNIRGIKEWKLGNNTPLCVPAICCSDMDIEEICKINDDRLINKTADLQDIGFRKFIRQQLGYEDLSILRDKLTNMGKILTDESGRIEKRLRLIRLSSGDIKGIKRFLTVIRFQARDRAIKFLAFADEKEVEKYSQISDKPGLFDNIEYPFVDLWNGLWENVRLRKNLGARTSGGFLETGREDNKQVVSSEEVDSKIQSIVLHLAAIHKRLKEAWERCERADESDSFSMAILDLEKDAKFLDSESLGLSNVEGELTRLLVANRTLGDDMLALGGYLTDVLAHLFEARYEREGRQDAYESKYPNGLNDFVKRVLNHYSEKGEKFDVNSTSNSFEVSVDVIDRETRHFETTPRKYLNTFRFRLYAVLLKIALAFYYMKENKCIAPIIIDDVFNASDFENSVSLSDFVFSIYDAYQDVLGYKEPLQLIMLTHDEMIVNAFQNGQKMKSRKMEERMTKQGMKDHADCVIFGRLFPYQEVESFNKKANLFKKIWSNNSFLSLYLDIKN